MGRRKRDPFIQIVVPKSLQHQILEAAHNDVLAGHLGITKTYAVVRHRFFFGLACLLISSIIVNHVLIVQ